MNMWSQLPARLRSAAIGLALLAGVGSALAEYPERPVTIVVPYAAGGATDASARLMAQALQKQTGGSFVVENVPGAGTTIGAARVARATPDGYTLLWGGLSSNAMAPNLYTKLTFDGLDSFAPVSLVASQPYVLFVSASSPIKTVADLLAKAKAQPDTFNFGSPGQGSSPHLMTELFLDAAGIKAQHVPYKGAAPAMTGLLGGEVQMMFDTPTAPLPMFKAGRLRPLAVTSARRLAELPDVPTLQESGLSGLEASTWFALFAPRGTPAAVVTRLNEMTRKALSDTAVLEQFGKAQFTPEASTPQALAQRVSAESSKWRRIIKDKSISLD
jgi:tripartite-type tricarboxylate transporter receptor subunit TctC